MIGGEGCASEYTNHSWRGEGHFAYSVPHVALYPLLLNLCCLAMLPPCRALHQGLQPKMSTSYEPIQERAARTLMLDIIQSPDGALSIPQIELSIEANP